MSNAQVEQVEIVRLAPMQVASFYGFGPEPEAAATSKLLAWAGPRGLLDAGVTHRVFGFNNPSPGIGSPNYGYEFWLELQEGDAAASMAKPGTDVGHAAGDMEIKNFPGGLFAVARCRGVRAVPDTWRALVTALEDSRYSMTPSQCLEQHIGDLGGSVDALEFALYQPIDE